MTRRRILFFLPLFCVAAIAALQTLPSATAMEWRRLSTDLGYSTTPPDFLVSGHWTRVGAGDVCSDYWSRYGDGQIVHSYGTSQRSNPAQYRTAGRYFEIRSGQRSDFLRRNGDVLVLYEDGFSRPVFGIGQGITQRRCRLPQ